MVRAPFTQADRSKGLPVLFPHRAVLLRASAAALALGAALGVQAAAGQALARRGAEQAERNARACVEAAAAVADLGALRPRADGAGPRPGEGPPGRCGPPHRRIP
ncbi:hypothetical protein [Kitasatospora sp. NBC_01539]|uniref:hypothetical protein n=1 Tax=Kitasatospora sp. NBC_01539 TaxID=2903577 RepID=UPI0038602C9A